MISKAALSAALALLLCAAFATAQDCQQSASIEDWKAPADGQPYPPITLCPGGTLTFKWTSRNGVAAIPSPDCPANWRVRGVGLLAPESPTGEYAWASPSPGTYYFSSPTNLPANCEQGQRVTVTVSEAPAQGAPAPAEGDDSTAEDTTDETPDYAAPDYA